MVRERLESLQRLLFNSADIHPLQAKWVARFE